jgi:hypothetical protein
MTAIALINLIVSIVAVGIFLTVVRAAHRVAGRRLEEVHVKEQAGPPHELERAA